MDIICDDFILENNNITIIKRDNNGITEAETDKTDINIFEFNEIYNLEKEIKIENMLNNSLNNIFNGHKTEPCIEYISYLLKALSFLIINESRIYR